MTPRPIDKNRIALYVLIFAVVSLAIISGYDLDWDLIGLKLSRE